MPLYRSAHLGSRGKDGSARSLDNPTQHLSAVINEASTHTKCSYSCPYPIHFNRSSTLPSPCPLPGCRNREPPHSRWFVSRPSVVLSRLLGSWCSFREAQFGRVASGTSQLSPACVNSGHTLRTRLSGATRRSGVGRLRERVSEVTCRVEMCGQCCNLLSPRVTATTDAQIVTGGDNQAHQCNIAN